MSNDAEVREVLIKAREIISTPERWTQYSFTDFHPGGLVSYCAIGAIYHGVPDYCSLDAESIRYRAAIQLSFEIGGSVINFNDSHTHEEVLALFDKVIAKLTPPPPPVVSAVPDVVVSWYDVPVDHVDELVNA